MAVRSVPINVTSVIIIVVVGILLLVLFIAPFFNIRLGREGCRLVMGTIGAGIGGITGGLSGAALQARCDWLTF